MFSRQVIQLCGIYEIILLIKLIELIMQNTNITFSVTSPASLLTFPYKMLVRA
mgnify:CR=1 FL=1